MKKSTKTLLAAFICTCALTFTGCGNNTSSGSSTAVNTTSSTATAANSAASSANSADNSAASTAANDSTVSATESTTVSAADSTANVSGAESAATSDALTPLWDNAQYKEDAEIGEGANTVKIEVKIGGKSITLSVKSDKDNLADILTDNKIVEGDDSEYGLYIKKVNGVSADYDTDGAYWGVCKDGTPTPTGVSSITIKDGEHYELVYTLADAAQPAA